MAKYSLEVLRALDGDTFRVNEDEEQRKKFTEGADVRVEGIDTYEVERDDKVTGNPLSKYSPEVIAALEADGGTLTTSGKFDRHGRQLAELRDGEGKGVTQELITAGLGGPTGFDAEHSVEEQNQAMLTGITRSALGQDRTDDPRFQDIARRADAERKEYKWRPFSDNPHLTMNLQPYDKRGDFHRAWDRGTAETKAAAGGALNWLGDALGSEELVEKGKAMTREGQAAAGGAVRAVEDFSKVNSVGDAFTYVVETTGEMAPGLIFDALATILTGGAGAAQAVARRAGTKAVTHALSEEAKEQLKEEARKAVASGVKKGIIAGPAASGFIQSVGNMENSLEAQGSEVNTGAAALSGTFGAVANAAPFAAVFGRLAKASGMGDEVIEGVSKRLKDIGTTGAISGGVEGLASTAQALVDKTIEKVALGKEDWDINATQMIDDTIRAVLGGGVAGSGASAGIHTAKSVMDGYDEAVRGAREEALNAGERGFSSEKERFEGEQEARRDDIAANGQKNLSIGDVAEFHEENVEAARSKDVTGDPLYGFDAALDIPEPDAVHKQAHYEGTANGGSAATPVFDFIESIAVKDGEHLPYGDFAQKVKEYNDSRDPRVDAELTDDLIVSYVASRWNGAEVPLFTKSDEVKKLGGFRQGINGLVEAFASKERDLSSYFSDGYVARMERDGTISDLAKDLRALSKKPNATLEDYSAFMSKYRPKNIAKQAHQMSLVPDARKMYAERFGASKRNDPKKGIKVRESKGDKELIADAGTQAKLIEEANQLEAENVKTKKVEVDELQQAVDISHGKVRKMRTELAKIARGKREGTTEDSSWARNVLSDLRSISSAKTKADVKKIIAPYKVKFIDGVLPLDVDELKRVATNSIIIDAHNTKPHKRQVFGSSEPKVTGLGGGKPKAKVTRKMSDEAKVELTSVATEDMSKVKRQIARDEEMLANGKAKDTKVTVNGVVTYRNRTKTRIANNKRKLAKMQEANDKLRGTSKRAEKREKKAAERDGGSAERISSNLSKKVGAEKVRGIKSDLSIIERARKNGSVMAARVMDELSADRDWTASEVRMASEMIKEAAAYEMNNLGTDSSVVSLAYIDKDGNFVEDDSTTIYVEGDHRGEDNSITNADTAEVFTVSRGRRMAITDKFFKAIKGLPVFEGVDLSSMREKIEEPNHFELGAGATSVTPKADTPVRDFAFSEEEVLSKSKDRPVYLSPAVLKKLAKAATDGDAGRFKQIVESHRIIEEVPSTSMDQASSPVARLLAMMARSAPYGKAYDGSEDSDGVYGRGGKDAVYIDVTLPDGTVFQRRVQASMITEFGASEMSGFNPNEIAPSDTNFLRNLAEAFYNGLTRINSMDERSSSGGFAFSVRMDNLKDNMFIYKTDVATGYTLRESRDKLEKSRGFDKGEADFSEWEESRLMDAEDGVLALATKAVVKAKFEMRAALRDGNKTDEQKARVEGARADAIYAEERKTLIKAALEDYSQGDEVDQGKAAAFLRDEFLSNEDEKLARKEGVEFNEWEDDEDYYAALELDRRESENEEKRSEVSTRRLNAPRPIQRDKSKDRVGSRAQGDKPSSKGVSAPKASPAFRRALSLVNVKRKKLEEAERKAKAVKGTGEGEAKLAVDFARKELDRAKEKYEAAKEIERRKAEADKKAKAKEKEAESKVIDPQNSVFVAKEKGFIQAVAEAQKEVERLEGEEDKGHNRAWRRRVKGAKAKLRMKEGALDVARKKTSGLPEADARAVLAAEKQVAEAKAKLKEAEAHSPLDAARRKLAEARGRLDSHRSEANQKSEVKSRGIATHGQNRRVVNKAKKQMLSGVYLAIHRALASARSQMEGINYTLAEALYTRSGNGNGDGSYARDRRRTANRFRIKLAESVKGGADAMQSAYEDAITGDPKTSNGKKLLEVIDEQNAYIKEHNPTYSGEGLPLVLNTFAIDKERRSFAAILNKHNIKDVEQFIEDMFAGHGMSDFSVNVGASRPLGIRRKNEELRKAYDDLREGGFIDNDAPSVLNRFAEASSSFAEWSRIFGGRMSNGKFDENGFFKHLVEKTKPEKREALYRIVEASTGRSRSAPHWLNVFNSTAFGFHAATILLLSGMASLPEFATIAGRARGEYATLGKDMLRSARSANRKELGELVSMFETYTAGQARHTLANLYFDGHLTAGKISQQVSETVFKLNGQQHIVEASYHLATKAGYDFIRGHSKEAVKGDAHSIRALDELGITVDEAKEWLIGNAGGENAIPKGIKRGVQYFVDESVTNPHTEQMPVWMSDPRFQIVATLKKFFYSFWENNHRQLYSEARKRGNAGAVVPIAMTLMFALPLAAVAEVLRELFKYPFSDRNIALTFEDRVLSMATATGGLGPFQTAHSAYEQSQFGRNMAVATMGPTPSMVYDMFSGDLKPSRFVPVASQQPQLRKMVDGMFKEDD